MRQIVGTILLAAVLAACGGGGGGAPPAAGGGGGGGGGGGAGNVWTFESIVTGADLGYFPRLVLGTAGRPHVSWLDLNVADGLYVESRRTMAGTWEHRGVASAKGPTLRGVRHDIGVSTTGAPLLSFEIPDDSIKLGTWNGSSFDVTTLSTDLDPFPGGSHPDNAWAFVGHNRMAVHPANGTVWVVMWLYNQVTGGHRTLRYWSSGAGGTGEIDLGAAGGDTYTGRGCSIALDAGGNPHVAWEGYHGSTFDNMLRYARWNGANFVVETVDPGTMPAGAASESYQPTSVAVDATGNPHIAYRRSGAYVLASWTGTAWSFQTISTDGVSAGTAWIDLAIAPDGTPHVAFFSLSGVRHAWRTGSTWNVDTITGDGITPAIRVGGDGTVHMVYWNSAFETLRYGTLSP